MISPAVFWPITLGLTFLVAGLWTYRRDLMLSPSRQISGFVAIGPVFVAASLATFAGEHFTAARSLAQLVPKFMPARLFIAYLVGAAHLAAALSLVARRCIRWSMFFLALMFALFVLLMDLPATLKHPAIRLYWSLAARQATFAMGAVALFSTQVRERWPKGSNRMAAIAAFWTGMVIIFYGVEHIVAPQYSPGVPDSQLTASWVPVPLAIAYLTGLLLIVFGLAMLIRRYAAAGGTFAGALMLVLTIVLYVPQFFLARGVSAQVNAFNFIFDTLLFSGTLLLVAGANLNSQSKPIAMSQSVN